MEINNVSLDIDNFINNDPILLMIFFSLSLFGSIIKLIFTENSKRKNKNESTGRIIVRMILLALTSSLVMFSGFELVRKYIKGNLIYLAIFFFGFISDIVIKYLVRIKSMSNLLKFIDDLYRFFKDRKP